MIICYFKTEGNVASTPANSIHRCVYHYNHRATQRCTRPPFQKPSLSPLDLNTPCDTSLKLFFPLPFTPALPLPIDASTVPHDRGGSSKRPCVVRYPAGVKRHKTEREAMRAAPIGGGSMRWIQIKYSFPPHPPCVSSVAYPRLCALCLRSLCVPDSLREAFCGAEGIVRASPGGAPHCR